MHWPRGVMVCVLVCWMPAVLGCRPEPGVVSQTPSEPAVGFAQEAEIERVVTAFLEAVRADDWPSAAEFFCTEFREHNREAILDGSLLGYDPEAGKSAGSILHHADAGVGIAWVRDGRARVSISAGGRVPDAQIGVLPLELVREQGQWRFVGFPLAWEAEASGDPGATSPCPTVAETDHPALLFVEATAGQERLYVATFAGDTVQWREILSAKYVRVDRLDDAVFLVEASEGAFKEKVFAVNLASGVMKLLVKSPRFKLLRTAPDRKKAMLISYTAGMTQIALVELDLASLELAVRHRISEELLGGKHRGPGLGMRLSPDFQHIAFMSLRDRPGVRRESRYELRLLNLATMEVSDFDRDVRVEISGASSHAMGVPPVEWVDSRRVLYQHVLPSKTHRPGYGLDRVHVLKIADVRTGQMSECLRGRLRLSSDGGNLRANPFNGEVIYRGQWVVAVDAGVLSPKEEPFATAGATETKWRTAIDGARETRDWGHDRALCLISARRKHLARGGRGIRVQIHGMQEPLQVCEGGDDGTWPVAWIEDTRPLRQRERE